MSGKITEKAIKEAFGSLLDEKPFDRITVKDISSRAGINRQTFYYHFTDIYDLALSIFIDACEECIGEDDDLCSAMLGFYDYFSARKRPFMNVLRSSQYGSLSIRLEPHLRKMVSFLLDGIDGSGRLSSDSRSMIIGYFTLSASSFICRWLTSGMDISRESVSQLSRIIESNLANTVRLLS